MKKMSVLLSALVLAIASLSPMASFAENEPADATAPQTIELCKEYDSSYRITIPAEPIGLTENANFEVSATALLGYGKELNVSVESKHNWQLQDKVTSNKHKISYKMKYDDTDIEDKKATILTVPSGKQTNSVNLTVYDIAEPTYAGKYSDTLTFTATPTETEVSEAQTTATEESTTTTTTVTTTTDDTGGQVE